MEGLTTYTLGELSINGKGSYGIGAPAVDFSKNKYMYLRITDINDDGTLSTSDRKSVDDPEAHKYVLHKNDIVFARTGNSTGRAYFYDERDGELVYAGFLIKFSLDPTKVNPKVLKYYTHSKPYYDWVKSFDTGATRGNINAQTFASMPIALPDKETQDRIVDILSAIDNKIRLNNRINHNLEEQAQALYKSWFVDFEPFQEGEFIESELGLIPKGWKVVCLDSLCSIISRGFSPKYSESTTDVVLGQRCVRNNMIDLSVSKTHVPKNLGERALCQYDILINSTGMGSLGRVAQIYFKPERMTYDSHLTLVRAKSSTLEMYLGRNLLSRQDEIENMAVGSTGQTELPRDSVKAMSILLPCDTVLDQFGALIRAIAGRIQSNLEENVGLTAMRDYLLPKLMSGELKINDLAC